MSIEIDFRTRQWQVVQSGTPRKETQVRRLQAGSRGGGGGGGERDSRTACCSLRTAAGRGRARPQRRRGARLTHARLPFQARGNRIEPVPLGVMRKKMALHNAVIFCQVLFVKMSQPFVHRTSATTIIGVHDNVKSA